MPTCKFAMVEKSNLIVMLQVVVTHGRVGVLGACGSQATPIVEALVGKH